VVIHGVLAAAAPTVLRTLATARLQGHRDRAQTPRIETYVIVQAPDLSQIYGMSEAQTLGQEQRLTFRVTVDGCTNLDAYLLLAGKRLAAVVGDVSAEGMFIRLERGLLGALKVDSQVVVEVAFEGEPFVLHGVIRSQHAGGYGIFFPERDSLGRANPLSRFGRIAAHLQRGSLSQRLKVLKLPE
jgi:hypothetical protein